MRVALFPQVERLHVACGNPQQRTSARQFLHGKESRILPVCNSINQSPLLGSLSEGSCCFIKWTSCFLLAVNLSRDIRWTVLIWQGIIKHTSTPFYRKNIFLMVRSRLYKSWRIYDGVLVEFDWWEGKVFGLVLSGSGVDDIAVSRVGSNMTELGLHMLLWISTPGKCAYVPIRSTGPCACLMTISQQIMAQSHIFTSAQFCLTIVVVGPHVNYQIELKTTIHISVVSLMKLTEWCRSFASLTLWNIVLLKPYFASTGDGN